MKRRKKITVLLLAAALLCALSPAAFAAQEPTTYAVSDMLVNVTTGETYYTKNVDVSRNPASLTKLMTVYMVYEAMARGELSKSSYVRISGHAGAIAADATASNVPLTVGQSYTVDELLAATMVVSACGAACALGEKLGGTESNFAELMTARARQSGWAMSFTDASGLDGGDRMTARSACALAKALITQYPDVLAYTSRTNLYFRGRSYHTTNYLLPGYGYTYAGADGLKTGSASTAGRCLVATALRDGHRLIAVVMGGSSDDVRFGDAIRMLDSGFSRTVTLQRSTARFLVNGNAAAIHAYTYAGGNYVSLRDLSAALTGTGNGYSVSWNASTNVITLTTGGSAAASAADCPETAPVAKGTAPFVINGSAVSVDSYTVNGVTYASLRAIAPALGLEVAFDGTSNTVLLTVDPATRSKTQRCTLDGKNIELAACFINDTGYYKLRDIAAVLSGTAKQFDVSWDAATASIALTSNSAYTPVGGELAAADGRLRFAVRTGASIRLDGQSFAPQAYTIGGNNYFKLRDLGAALGFGVDWDAASGTVLLTTGAAASPETSAQLQSASPPAESTAPETRALPENTVPAESALPQPSVSPAGSSAPEQSALPLEPAA